MSGREESSTAKGRKCVPKLTNHSLMRRIASEQKTLTRVVSPPLYETKLKSKRKFQHRHDLRGRKGFAPREAAGEQPMGGCSLGAPTSLAEAVALARHAPGGALPPPYQRRRRSLRARAPEQHTGTLSRSISTHVHFEPWEARALLSSRHDEHLSGDGGCWGPVGVVVSLKKCCCPPNSAAVVLCWGQHH